MCEDWVNSDARWLEIPLRYDHVTEANYVMHCCLYPLYTGLSWLVVGGLHPGNIEVQISMGTNSCWLNSSAPLGDQAASTMTWYQSHYPDTEPTSPYPILVMRSAWLGSDKYPFLSHCFDSNRVSIPRTLETADGCTTISAILSGPCA